MALEPAGEGDIGAPLGKGGHDLAQISASVMGR